MRSSFIHLALAFFTCVLALIGYWIWYGAIADKSADVAALQSRIDARTATINRLATTRAALAELSGDEMTVRSYFVPETGVVAFIDGLEVRGRTLGTSVKVESVSTGGTTAKPTLEFVLSVTGTFDNVMRTVGSIEFAPYAITVSRLAIEQVAKNTWRADLKLLIGSRAPSASTPTP